MSHWLDNTMPIPEAGCRIWLGGCTRKGYGQTSVDGRKVYVHRLAYEEAVGPIPDGMFVCHTCDVRSCCEPTHLFLGTPLDNIQDASRKGRMHPGEKNYNAKLNDAAIAAIIASTKTQRELADEYGVSQSLISRVRSRKAWRACHVTLVS